MKKAFTLAEVLITLGIIGIVAAMTLPALIQNYKNHVVETRLKKFYSTINQLVLMSEAENGDKKTWWGDYKGGSLDDDGNIIEGSSEQLKWFNKYFAPYLKGAKIEIKPDSNGKDWFLIRFADGSELCPSNNNTRDWAFFPGGYENCKKLEKRGIVIAGVCHFHFEFVPTTPLNGWKYHYNKGFEPWKYAWDGNIETLRQGCYNGTKRYFCTALIQMNGWKIPKDYPYKVNY